MIETLFSSSYTGNTHIIICENIEKSLKNLKISFPNDGHDIYHLRRVCSYALNIAKHIHNRGQVRMSLLITGAYLHDLHRISTDWEWIEYIVRTISDEHSISLEDLLFILHHHDDAKLYSDSCMEFRIIQDADKLDRIGINGIVRAIRFGACIGEIYFDPNNSNNTLNHLMELVSNWNVSKECFNTIQAYKMSKKFKKDTIAFIRKSKVEWSGYYDC